MFYVSSIRQRGLVGITDTLDDVEEFYNLDAISCFLARGVMILGAGFKNANGGISINVIGKESAKLLRLQQGMPVRVMIPRRTNGYVQCLLIRLETSGVVLFDGTLSSLSFSFIDTMDVKIDTENNDPVEVSTLLQQIKKCS